MTNFYAFLAMACKGLVLKRNIFIMLCMFLIMLFAADQGIIEQKNSPGKTRKFIRIQEKYFENATNYDGYGRDGITMLYVPSAARVFARNTVMTPDTTAKADSVVTLQINNNMKGKSLISQLFFGCIDVCLVILAGFTLLAMFYGHESIHSPGYLKFLSAIIPGPGVLRSLVYSRFLSFTFAFLVQAAGLMLVIFSRGIRFTNNDYKGLFILLLVSLAMLLIFFLIGFSLGTVRSLKASLFLLFFTWIALVLVVPLAFVSAHEDNFPDVNTDFKTALKKFDNVINFEKEVENKEGKFDREKIKNEQKIAIEYLDKVFKKNELEEARFKNRIESDIRKVNQWGVLFPTTFYMLTCSEVSSCGYRGFISFFIYAIDMMRKFVFFWVDRVFFHDINVLVSFIKKDEHIFRARSRLPQYAGSGFAVLFLYIISLYSTACFCSKRFVHPVSKRVKAFESLDINFKTGQKTIILTYEPDFTNQLLNVFLNKPRVLNWNVCINGKNIINSGKQEFLYIPDPDTLPGDIKTRHFLYFLKRSMKIPGKEWEKIKNSIDEKTLNQRFGDMDKTGRAKLILKMALAANKSIYIFDNFITGVPQENRLELAKLLDQGMGKDTVVIDLVSNDARWLDHDNMMTIIYKNNRYEKIPKPV